MSSVQAQSNIEEAQPMGGEAPPARIETAADVAKAANANRAQKAFIKSAEAYVFQKPNFDAEVITILTPTKNFYFIYKFSRFN